MKEVINIRMETLSHQEIKYIQENYTQFTPDWHLRPPKIAGIDWKKVLPQMEARKKAREKLPAWTAIPELIFPVRLSVEQCSSEQTATWKGEYIRQIFPECNEWTLTDLSGGFGVDCWHLAQSFRQAVYVERDPDLCAIAAHNFRLLGGTSIHVVCQSAEDYLSEAVPSRGLAFIDPARRNDKQQKLVALSDCSPDVPALINSLRKHFRAVLLKLSPMLDIRAALRDLPDSHRLEIWASQKECKEMIVLLDFTKPAPVSVPICARYEGQEAFCFDFEEEGMAESVIATSIGSYLYEPNVAILKAGAFRCAGTRFGLQKLHPHSHLYTSDRLLAHFPGRTFRVLKTFGFKDKDIKEALQGIEACQLTVRNFPMKAPEVLKKLKLRDGGNLTLFATTTHQGTHRLLLCEKI